MTSERLLVIQQLLNHPAGVGEAWTKQLQLELMEEVEDCHTRIDYGAGHNISIVDNPIPPDRGTHRIFRSKRTTPSHPEREGKRDQIMKCPNCKSMALAKFLTNNGNTLCASCGKESPTSSFHNQAKEPVVIREKLNKWLRHFYGYFAASEPVLISHTVRRALTAAFEAGEEAERMERDFEIATLKQEIEVLRHHGNRGCIATADARLAELRAKEDAGDAQAVVEREGEESVPWEKVKEEIEDVPTGIGVRCRKCGDTGINNEKAEDGRCWPDCGRDRLLESEQVTIEKSIDDIHRVPSDMTARAEMERGETERKCDWCKDDISARARRDAKCCSKKCRQAKHRFRVGVASYSSVTRPMGRYASSVR